MNPLGGFPIEVTFEKCSDERLGVRLGLRGGGEGNG